MTRNFRNLGTGGVMVSQEKAVAPSIDRDGLFLFGAVITCFVISHFWPGSNPKLVTFGCVLLVAFCFWLFVNLPMLVANTGRTGIAQVLALMTTSVLSKVGILREQYAKSLLKTAYICRLNGRYDKSIQLCKDAVLALEVCDQVCLEPSEPRRRPQSDNIAEAHLMSACSYFDIGDYANSRIQCNSALLAGARNESRKPLKVAGSPGFDANVLTRTEIALAAELLGQIMIGARSSQVAARAHELLGLIASLENNLTEVNEHFVRAHALRPSRNMFAWEMSFDAACRNLAQH